MYLWCAWQKLFGRWAGAASRRIAPFTLPFGHCKFASTTQLSRKIFEFWQAISDASHVRLALTTVQVHGRLKLETIQQNWESSHCASRFFLGEHSSATLPAKVSGLPIFHKGLQNLLATCQLDVLLLICLVWKD